MISDHIHARLLCKKNLPRLWRLFLRASKVTDSYFSLILTSILYATWFLTAHCYSNASAPLFNIWGPLSWRSSACRSLWAWFYPTKAATNRFTDYLSSVVRKIADQSCSHFGKPIIIRPGYLWRPFVWNCSLGALLYSRGLHRNPEFFTLL